MSNEINNPQNPKTDPLTGEERARSNFVRELVQRTNELPKKTENQFALPPRLIVQFWDNLDRLPSDVKECMNSWKILKQSGFEIVLYDENTAKEFIKTHLGSRYVKAFCKCYHPSMKSDYFRYAYIFVNGGFYVDVDDVYHGKAIDRLFEDGRLKLQPFCYDIVTAQMISPHIFLKPGANKWSWIFYFNTTPLIAVCSHPIVKRALLNATEYLENDSSGELPEVQASTGPGNLTRSIFEMLSNESNPSESIVVLHEWEQTSTSKWHLSYRNDNRNWRLSNQQKYSASQHLENL